MGFMDELKKLTQPYEDDDDFYEGADESFTAPPPAQKQNNSNAQEQFESSFADEQYSEPEPAKKKLTGRKSLKEQATQVRPQRQQRRSSQQRSEPQVVLFNPKNFDEAGELASYLVQGRSLVMALEGIPPETARRLLDFISGIAFALNAKITPVSAKTYFVTPEDVDLLGATPQNTADSDY